MQLRKGKILKQFIKDYEHILDVYDFSFKDFSKKHNTFYGYKFEDDKNNIHFIIYRTLDFRGLSNGWKWNVKFCKNGKVKEEVGNIQTALNLIKENHIFKNITQSNSKIFTDANIKTKQHRSKKNI